MVETVAIVGKRLRDRRLTPTLPQLALATLVDNALEHAGDAPPPVAAVYMTDTFVTVTIRDSGQSVAGSGRAADELRRRIQLPAEDVDPGPGAPAGIAWLARRLEARCPGGRLDFWAGDGCLSFWDGVWVCRVSDRAVVGFVAIARIALN